MMSSDSNELSNEALQLNKVKESLVDQIAKTIALQVGSKYSDFNCTRRSNKLKADSHRKGPVPVEDCLLTKNTQAATYGTLDSECEELDFEEVRNKNNNSTLFNKIRVTVNEKGYTIASCRALIVYFSKLAKTKDEEELIDLNFVENLFDSGADINFPDKHGQTILHEISRGWHADVAKFVLEHGADINKADFYGRTPLHLAAAVDYGEMVEYLVENGADLMSETYEEKQTPMHYAAKNNAQGSLKIMLRLGAQINARDYKGRTPLFVAAETGRAESARFLIEQGAPCGVYDNSGTPLLSILIEKMPQIAIEAVEQFHILDRAFRKHYYYLASLEPDPKFLLEKIPETKHGKREQKARNKGEKKLLKEQGKKVIKKPKCHAKMPLEVIIQYDQLDLIMHPVFQRLLYVKWHLFGKRGATWMLILNLFYTLIWTILGILIPGDRVFYSPASKHWWRIIMEMIGVGLTIYFLVSEVLQVRSNERFHNYWRTWRVQNMERDIKFCHPRWPEEEKYLISELEQIRSYQGTYFREPWNIFEWIMYAVVLAIIVTRIVLCSTRSEMADKVHTRVYALALVIIWLRFMRSCRSFRSLGPFIAVLGSVSVDTLKFAFLFFEFFIPYTVGFYILFGGAKNEKAMGEASAINWVKFHDLTYSVWVMSLMGDFDWKGLAKVDRLMAQLFCGTYFALVGVVCMNLYIALLSDTFARVYSQAQANAVMQQAKAIILLESKLSKDNKSKYGHYMQDLCSPQEVYTRDEGNQQDDHDQDMLDRVSRQIINRIDELDESLNRKKFTPDYSAIPSSPRKSLILGGEGNVSNTILNFVTEQTVFNAQVKKDMDFLISTLTDINLSLRRKALRNELPSTDMTRSATLPTRGSSHQKQKEPYMSNPNLPAMADARNMQPLHDPRINYGVAPSLGNLNQLPPQVNQLPSQVNQLPPQVNQLQQQQILNQQNSQIQQGIQDMEYLQQRLQEYDGTEQEIPSRSPIPPRFSDEDSVRMRGQYPDAAYLSSDGGNGVNTPKSSGKRRRRRKRSGSKGVIADDKVPLVSTRPQGSELYPSLRGSSQETSFNRTDTLDQPL